MEQQKPVEIPLITFHATQLVKSDPYVDRAKDGREVLMCGPRVAAGWPVLTLAEQRAVRESLPVVKLTARECLTVATGGVVDTTTRDGEPARVRLATTTELMLANRRPIDGIPEEQLPPPMTAKQAAELIEPLVLPKAQRQELLEQIQDRYAADMTGAHG